MSVFKIIDLEAHIVECNHNEGEVETQKSINDYDMLLGTTFSSISNLFYCINKAFNTDFSPETSSYSDTNKLFINCYLTKKHKTPTYKQMESFKKGKINLLSICLTITLKKMSIDLVNDFKDLNIKNMT